MALGDDSQRPYLESIQRAGKRVLACRRIVDDINQLVSAVGPNSPPNRHNENKIPVTTITV
jgi:hypothetical protein